MTTITRQIHFAINSRRKTAMPGPAPERNEAVGRTPRVAKLMALAIRFDQLLRDGKVADQSELARLAHVTQPRMTQIMNLLHLAPDIQEAILHLPPVAEGRDPVTERDLRPIARLWDWAKQRAMWRVLRNSRCRVLASSLLLNQPRGSFITSGSILIQATRTASAPHPLTSPIGSDRP